METINATDSVVTAIVYNCPIGTVMPYMGLKQNLVGLRSQGWLACDGATYKTNEQRRLYDAIGNAFGGSSSEFYVPDLRGVFLRGVDEDTKRDPDAATRTGQNSGANTGDSVGSRQEDEFKSHKHTTKVSDPSSWFSITHSGSDWNPPRDKKDLESSEVGGKETRPKNVNTYYIIFAGLPA